MSAYNAFQKLHRRVPYKVGSLEHRRQNQSVAAEWASMTDAEKSHYEDEAIKMQAARDALRTTALKDKNSYEECSRLEERNLSPAQIKRLTTQRLDKSLQQVASHRCWERGLAMWDHNSAIRGSLMHLPSSAADAEKCHDTFLRAFGYDAEILSNPGSIPCFRRSCVTTRAGTCTQDACYEQAAALTSQFDAALELRKLGGSPLLVRFWVSDSDAAASSWHVLAGVCKRPLCHSVVSFYEQVGTLRLRLESGLLCVGSMQMRLQTLLQQHMAEAGVQAEDIGVQAFW